MEYKVNVEDEFNKAKQTYFRFSLLFSIISIIVIGGDALLITLSKESYMVQYIIATIITILFGWYAIFFFSTIYRDINARYRYFKNYESGLKANDEVEFIRQDNELQLVNGLYVYPLYVKYFEGINTEEKIIFTLADKINFQEGDKLTITTYQRVLIKAERHK